MVGGELLFFSNNNNDLIFLIASYRHIAPQLVRLSGARYSQNTALVFLIRTSRVRCKLFVAQSAHGGQHPRSADRAAVS